MDEEALNHHSSLYKDNKEINIIYETTARSLTNLENGQVKSLKTFVQNRHNF